MDYRNMTKEQLESLRAECCIRGNANASVEIADFIKLYNKQVKVVKGRKVPKGTTGIVFWVKRYDYSKYGDPWGIYSDTKIGIRDEWGNAHFTSSRNVEIIEGGDEE